MGMRFSAFRGLKSLISAKFLSSRLISPVTITDLVAMASSLKGADLKVLQVGAHDGKSRDPILRVTGSTPAEIVLVEANPDSILRLQKNYSSAESVRIIYGALMPNPQEAEVTLYRFSPESVGIYPDFGGTSSLSRGHLIEAFQRNAHRFPPGTDVESLIAEVVVPVLGPKALVDDNDLIDTDILVVDAEGMDWEIVRSLIEAGLRPSAVFYESRFMGVLDQEESLDFLVSLGYAPLDFGHDTGAIKYPNTVEPGTFP